MLSIEIFTKKAVEAIIQTEAVFTEDTKKGAHFSAFENTPNNKNKQLLVFEISW
jgi:hypothetical protein